MTTPQELAEAAIKAAEANAELNIARAEGRKPEDTRHPAFIEAERKQRVADEEVAAERNCTVEQVAGARSVGMPLEEYIAFAGGPVTLADARRIESESEAERRARREAEHWMLVEKIKAKLP